VADARPGGPKAEAGTLVSACGALARRLDQIWLNSAMPLVAQSQVAEASDVYRFVVHPDVRRWVAGVNVWGVADEAEDGRSRWRTFGERTIYDNPWVWLGQIDVEIPGGERFWHHVVRLHRAAVMVLVDEHDRVLMMWRHRFVQDRWGWELPGGLIDEGEEPEETAVRELEEETGYRAGRVEHLVTYQPMVGMVDSEHAIFIGRDPEKVTEPVEQSEADRIEWIPLASVPELISAGKIWNSGVLVGLWGLMATQR
jgi:8-oxo-dGTP pyrophosphatase MutT (NUDIX family)